MASCIFPSLGQQLPLLGVGPYSEGKLKGCLQNEFAAGWFAEELREVCTQGMAVCSAILFYFRTANRAFGVCVHYDGNDEVLNKMLESLSAQFAIDMNAFKAAASVSIAVWPTGGLAQTGKAAYHWLQGQSFQGPYTWYSHNGSAALNSDGLVYDQFRE